MKILLIQPPEQEEVLTTAAARARNLLPPLGLLYLAGHLKRRHRVEVVDMAASGAETADLPDILNRFRPHLVGVTTVITLWATVLELLRTVKRIDPGIRTVVGGPNASKYPVETLSHPEVDYLITGMGQRPLMALCDRLESGRPANDIENCFARGQSYAAYGTVRSPADHLDRFPIPDRRAVPYRQYVASVCPEAPCTSMITSMGCPYRCAYCSSRKEQHFQLRSPDGVLSEMAAVEAMGIRSVLFQDELFTLKPERVRTLCEGMIRKGIRLNWLVKSRVDSVTPGMAELMKRAGCFGIHFGIESGNDTTLARMNKGYTVGQVRQSIAQVKDAGLACTGNFMLGYPGEDEADILRTIDFACELNLDMANFVITYDVPQTDLYYEALSAGRRSHDPWSEFVTNPGSGKDRILAYASDRFDAEQLEAFVRLAFSRTRTLFDLNRQKGLPASRKG